MAENQAVWGIDIGQAGLKAIKLRYAEASKQVLAVGFDYVPHPKILSQPDAVPDELVWESLQTFLSRNETQGDKIAISVPGQTSLAKFIKLPPVEASKIAEIVKYEARQQIPFDLDDVIWDYQPLGGGVEESGFMLEAEVGLFAMKRDQVAQHLSPFTDAKLEVELIQTAPLALYNFVAYDYLDVRVDQESGDADGHVIVLDMGADNTTLLVSNGHGIWIRNVPIGGNHFTRALTRDMKLTFAKAEHLKCNATRSPDPKAVFQSLRPVFNDYVSEIQRSIGYFSSVNREARIRKVLGVGNGFRLAGLQKFLQQNLQYEVERVDHFKGAVGDGVLNAPLFSENIMTFAVPYGLALQCLDLTRVTTTLLPPEIATARKIRHKKPGAVAAAAALLATLSLSLFGYANVYSSVSEQRWGEAEKQVKDLVAEVGRNRGDYEGQTSEHSSILNKGATFVGSLDRREKWMELYRAINESLPRDHGDARDIEDPTKKNRIKITSITAAKVADVKADWFDDLGENALETMLKGDRDGAPSGKGYIVSLKGVHYRSDPGDVRFDGRYFVEEQFLRNGLQQWTLDQDGTGEAVPVRQMGTTHAALTEAIPSDFRYDPSKSTSHIRGLAKSSGGGMGMMGGGGFDLMSMMMGGESGYGGGDADYGSRASKEKDGTDMLFDDASEQEEIQTIKQTSFTVQFIWQHIAVADREESDTAAAAQSAAGNDPSAIDGNT